MKVTEKVTVSGGIGYRKTTRHPKINIAGKWLQSAGFAVGEVVNVLISDQAIHIIRKGGNNGRV